MRRVTRTVGYGLHRVRSDGARSVLVVAGVAAAGLLLASVLVGSLVAQERALARAVDQLPPSARTVRAAWFGVPGEGDAYGALDARVRDAVGGRPTPTVLFRESSIGGRYVAFGAVDGLGPHVRLTSGRLPRRCTAARCEVLQLRGSGPPPRRLVVVGRGVLRSTALFGDAVPADRNELDRARLAPRLQRSIRYHQPAAPPLLLTEGVRAAASLPDLANTYRSYGWVSELHGRDVHPWSVRGLVADAARARAELQAASVGFDVVAPAEELTAARDRTTIGARRLLLLGGQGAALLLAFAAFAATRLRRPAEASDRRLRCSRAAVAAEPRRRDAGVRALGRRGRARRGSSRWAAPLRSGSGRSGATPCSRRAAPSPGPCSRSPRSLPGRRARGPPALGSVRRARPRRDRPRCRGRGGARPRRRGHGRAPEGRRDRRRAAGAPGRARRGRRHRGGAAAARGRPPARAGAAGAAARGTA